jgi:hypothetical protein
MNLKKFIENANLDFSDLYFEEDTGTTFHFDFEIKPGDFITFAKADLYDPGTRGLVNALSNAKRAIDCQADGFLNAIGIDSSNIEKQLGREGIASIAYDKSSKNGLLKFRLLEVLGIATPSIVKRMRTLRNLLEHEYKKPSRRSVSDAIGVAELFVQACGGKMKNIFEGFGFGSGVTTARGRREIARELYFRFSTEPKTHFEIWLWNHEKPTEAKRPEIKVFIGDSYFVPLLKLNFQVDWDKDTTPAIKAFLTELGFQLPSKFCVRDAYDLR